MKTLSLRSRAALTSAIRAPRPADELQDKIKDLTFWPAGNPGSSSGSPCGPVAVGGAADPWIAVPGTAADHPVLAVSRYSCAAVAGVASVSVVPAVLRPLINIAVDVVATPRDSARSCRPTLRSPRVSLGARLFPDQPRSNSRHRSLLASRQAIVLTLRQSRHSPER